MLALATALNINSISNVTDAGWFNSIALMFFGEDN